MLTVKLCVYVDSSVVCYFPSHILSTMGVIYEFFNQTGSFLVHKTMDMFFAFGSFFLISCVHHWKSASSLQEMRGSYRPGVAEESLQYKA